jgi:hypothetical protein
MGMTFSLDYIRKKLGWCPNERVTKIKSGDYSGLKFHSGDSLVKSPGSSGADGSGMPLEWWYEHTQRGVLITGSVIAVIIILLASMYLFGIIWVTALVLCFMVFMLAIFSTLTVSIGDDALRIRFGPIRLIRKIWPITEITSATVVTNPWYYGWGIRLTPYGTLYNISGFGAVEVRLFTGKAFRIGTDEPETLCRAIEKARKKNETIHPGRGNP